MNSDALHSYPAFAYLRRLGADAARLNLLLVLLIASVLLMGAVEDRTLLMSRSDVGLLEHPGIWWFLVGQAWLPFVARRSVRRFDTISESNNSALSPRYLSGAFQHQRVFMESWLKRDTNVSKLVYGALLTVGAGAWAWNSYSNQRPAAVGFDFWDSSRHIWGYSITRIYKLYVWLALMPALVHLQLGLIAVTRRTLTEARKERSLLLQPFHADGAGGLSVFLEIALSPMVPSVFIASMISLSAALVHQRYDITTLGGLTLTCSTFVAMYLVPATALRRAIAAEKRNQISAIATLQQHLYADVKDHQIISSKLQGTVDTMLSLSSVAERIRAVSEWPQLRFTVRLTALAWGSPALVWAAKIFVSRLTGALAAVFR